MMQLFWDDQLFLKAAKEKQNHEWFSMNESDDGTSYPCRPKNVQK